VTTDEVRALFEHHGAMLRGHFLLSSGRHSDTYVQKARVLEDPTATMSLAGEIASWYRAVDAVVAPAVGAIVLGFAVALATGARSLFAEREDGRMSLRRGFQLAPGERTLVVEDVLTTGASAKAVHGLVAGLGAEPLGIAALIDRTAAGVGPAVPMRAVLRVEAGSWPPEACPLCATGRPLDAPGSRHLAGPRLTFD
jgi:orotate phosphoribosyltransferase